MRCLVDRRALLQGLRRVVPAAARKNGVPAFQAVRMTAADGELRLFATDLELGAEVTVAAQIDRPGVMAPMLRRLLLLLQAAPAAAIELEATDDLLGTRLRWAEAEYLVYGVAPDLTVTPPVPPDDAPALFMDAAQLRWLLHHTAAMAAQDENRPYLTGVNLQLDGGRLRAVATDSIRIAAAWTEVENAPADLPSLIIPRRSCLYLQQILARVDGEVELRPYLSSLYVYVRVDSTRVVTRLAEGQYPDVLRLVPQNHDQMAALSRESFLSVLRRQAVLSTGGAVRLAFSDQGIYASVSVPDVGMARERVQGDYAGGRPLEIGFNSRYLIEALALLESEIVSFAAAGPRNPVRIRPVGNGDQLHVVLPLITY